MPAARRVLERLPFEQQDRVLSVLETELGLRAASAQRLQSKGRTYLRAPVGEGLDAIYRALEPDEGPEPRTPTYALYALLRGEVPS